MKLQIIVLAACVLSFGDALPHWARAQFNPYAVNQGVVVPPPKPTTIPIPTTSPSSDQQLRIESAERESSIARTSLEQAKAAVVAALRTQPDYAAASADAATKKAALEAARANGSIQDRLDAGAAYNKSLADVAKMEETAEQKDPAFSIAQSAEKEKVNAVAEVRKAVADELSDWVANETERLARRRAVEGGILNLQVGASGRILGGFRIIQVIDPMNMLVQPLNSEGLVWMKGFSTKGLADDQLMNSPIVTITKTTSYENGIHAKCTVLQAEPYKEQ